MPQIKILKKAEFGSPEDNTYILSEIGKLVIENMFPLLNILEVIEENKEYRANRKTGVIPNELSCFYILNSCISSPICEKLA